MPLHLSLWAHFRLPLLVEFLSVQIHLNSHVIRLGVQQLRVVLDRCERGQVLELLPVCPLAFLAGFTCPGTFLGREWDWEGRAGVGRVGWVGWGV